MKINKKKCSSLQPINPTKSSDEHCFGFFGLDRSGKFRVKFLGEKFLVDGAIYVLKEMIDYQGKKKMEKFLLKVSPGFKLNGDQDLYKMTCYKTGQHMLITGDFTLCINKSKS